MDITEENNLQFDYSPWQRTEKKFGSPNFRSNKSLLDKPALTPSLQKSNSCKTPISRISPSSASHVSSPVAETLFPNLHQEYTKSTEVSLPEKRKSKDGNIALLKLLIKERRLALQANKQRYMKFIRENLKMKDEISSFEGENHNNVKELLTKYKKYQGALTVLNTTHVSSLKQEEMELHKTQEKIEKMLQVLKSDSEELDMKIEKEKHALKVLHNYKEKEYPDKLEQMKHLQYEIDLLDAEFVAGMSELQNIADVERYGYMSNAGFSQDETITELAKNTLLTMEGSIKEMARQNVFILQEINFHREEFDRHQKEIFDLESEIRKLKEKEETKTARRKHPEKFLETCFPETEFELRIPKQRYLPI